MHKFLLCFEIMVLLGVKMKFLQYALFITGAALVIQGAIEFHKYGLQIAHNSVADAVFLILSQTVHGYVLVVLAIFARLNDRLRKLEDSIRQKDCNNRLGSDAFAAAGKS